MTTKTASELYRERGYSQWFPWAIVFFAVGAGIMTLFARGPNEGVVLTLFGGVIGAILATVGSDFMHEEPMAGFIWYNYGFFWGLVMTSGLVDNGMGHMFVFPMLLGGFVLYRKVTKSLAGTYSIGIGWGLGYFIPVLLWEIAYTPV